MLTLNQRAYCNQEKQIPIMEIKEYGKTKLINNYERSGVVALDEFFTYIDDRVVNNIIPERYSVSTYGRIYDHALGKFIEPIDNGNGFMKVKLSYYISVSEIASKDVYISSIVMLMFNYTPGAEAPRRSGITINHSNNDPSDNRLCNLEYNIPKRDTRYIEDNKSVCSNLIDNTLSMEDPRQPIRVVCALIQDGYSNSEIEKITNVPTNLIHDIRRGHSYSKFSKDYSFPTRRTSRIDNDTVIKICEMIQAGGRNKDIANELGINPHIVAEIRSRKNYSYISCNYKW